MSDTPFHVYRKTTSGNNTNETSGDLLSERYSDLWFVKLLTGLVITNVVFSHLYSSTLAYLTTTAGRRLYNRMFERLLRTPIWFFESNPVGKIV